MPSERFSNGEILLAHVPPVLAVGSVDANPTCAPFDIIPYTRMQQWTYAV